MADWVLTKLNCLVDLKEIPAREDVLTEIKIKFSSMTAIEAFQVTKNLNLSRLFCQLTSNDREFVEQICDALKIISEASEPGQILYLYTPEIYRLLSHQLPSVKNFALEEILRAASNPVTLPMLLTKIDLLTLAVETVADENLGVAKNAMNIFKNIGQNNGGLQILYSGSLLRSFAKLLSMNDTIKFRVYEIVIDIAKKGKENLEATISSGFLQSLIYRIEDDDILVQLNALEMLTELALTEGGLNYLQEQGVLQQLSQKIVKANETMLSNLLIPGLIKFFANVAKSGLNEYPGVITAFFEAIQSDDQIILGHVLDALGYISSTVNGKYALQDLGNAMPFALKRISHIIQTMPSELRVRALKNLALILSLNKLEHDNRILSLIKSWFDCLCEEPLKMIVSLCKQPFADIRQASLEVLAVIASQEWGQEYIASFPGLIEFLFDRNIESFKECKEAKFEIVKSLSESESNIFDAQTMQRFKTFVNQGPFYVDTITEVVIEGGP